MLELGVGGGVPAGGVSLCCNEDCRDQRRLDRLPVSASWCMFSEPIVEKEETEVGRGFPVGVFVPFDTLTGVSTGASS